MKLLPRFLVFSIVTVGVLTSIRYFQIFQSQSNTKISQLSVSKNLLDLQIASLEASYSALQNTDQVKVNKVLNTEIAQIRQTYSASIDVYEKLLKLRETFPKTDIYDQTFAKIIMLLSKGQYLEAQAQIAKLNLDLDKKNQDLAASFKVPVNIKESSSPPNSGYSRQLVKTDIGDFVVDIISADLKTTKVVVDTSSDKDCKNDCPVNMLSEFASRSGAFAAINGPYFCPATYPSCVGKTNSFDTLLMNKNKVYFNSDNNVYSSVPAAIFSTSSRFVAQSSEWGRDTGIDSVIAGQPLLVFNGESKFAGDGDVKKSSTGSRSFIGATDSTVYIGVVHNASVAQASIVIAKMGIRNAVNLDSGASTGLWLNGKSIITPSRATPFGILFVKR